MFDWADFLVLATELAGRSGVEAAERAAISRAYYATYGVARAYQRRSGTIVPARGRAHLLVWDHFHAVPDRVHRRIADRGRRLRRRRDRADYDDTYPDLSAEALDSVDLARRLLADLAALP